MLIRTISFDIPNLRDNSTESFLIPDTIDNQEFVLSHRYTRNIRFGKTFDIQLEKDMRMPVEMISDVVWLALLPEMEKEMSESEIDSEFAAIDKANTECQCENSACAHTDVNGEFTLCKNEANPELRVIFIGQICNECAVHYPTEYFVTDEN